MGLPAPVLPDFHVPVQLNSSTVQNYGITLWIYNEIPQKDSLRFEFLDEKEPYSSNSVSIWPPPDGELAG